MSVNTIFSAITVAAVTAFSATSALAVPTVGAPINGTPTLPCCSPNVTAANTFTNLIFSGAPSASTNDRIILNRDDGLGNLASSSPYAPVNITRNPVWLDPGVDDTFSSGADWVSYADTGDGGGVPNNSSTQALFTYKFDITTENFGLTNFGFWVYADDTAEVFISGAGIVDDGTSTTNGTADGVADGRLRISNPRPDQQDGNCAEGAIGCTLNEQSFVEMFGLLANETYSFEIDVYQRGGGPSGLLFAGGFVAVPEPGTLALLGLGVLGLGVTRRRRKAA